MQHQISLPAKHTEMLRTLAEQTGLSKSEVIRRALEMYYAAKQTKTE